MNYQNKSKEEIIKELEKLQNLYANLKESHTNDISELGIAKNNLAASEQKFRKLTENMSDIIWELSPDMKFTYISPGIEKLTGFKASEILGKNVFDLMDPLQVDQIKNIFHERQENFKLTGLLSNITYEFRQLCKNGDFIWVNVSFDPKFNTNNELLGFQGITRDISESKKSIDTLKISEEKLSQVFDNAPFVISLLRISDRKLLDINKAVEELTGYSREEILIDTSVIASVWGNLEQRARFYNAVQNKERLHQFEIEYQARNGKIGHTLLSTEFITIDNELCVLSFFEIITKRKQAEELLEENREKYRGLSEAAFDAIFISEKGICLEQNQQAEQMFGYTSSEAIGRYGTDWIVPEDREIVLTNMILGYEEPYRVSALRKDGSTFPALVRAKVMNFKGRKVRVTSLSDISLQINAEQRLIESEKQFRLIFENSNDAIFWADTETGILIKCNKAGEKLTERNQDEIIGKHFSILHPVEKIQKHKDEFTDQVKHKGDLQIETEILTKSGQIKIVEVISTVISIEGKEINQGIFKDISDKKRLEEALKNVVTASGSKDDENIFTTLVSNLSIALNVKYAMIGQITGSEVKKIKPLATCLDNKMIENVEYDIISTPCAEVLEKGICSYYENVQQLFPNDLTLGQLNIESYMGMPLKNSKGDVLGIIAILSDAKLRQVNDSKSVLSLFAYRAANELERKQDEDAILDSWANLLALVENTRDVIWAVDQNYNLVFINGQFEHEFKSAFGIQLVPGMNILEKLPEPFVSEWKTRYDKALAGDRFIFEEHFEFGDNHIYSEVAMNPIIVNDIVIGVSVFTHDITERKQAEILVQAKNKEIAAQNEEYLQLNEELLQANEELSIAKEKAEESDRLKTSFLQNMSHEIRTPMNAIMGFSSLLANQYNNRPKLEQYSEIINSRCSDLLDIINDILDIAKIESGQIGANTERCDLNLLFLELLSFFKENQKRIGKDDIQFNMFSLPNIENNMIITDAGKLKQIFINLIGNAFKFTELGKIEGNVRIDNNMLFFSLADTGIGIPADKKDFIFERFAQVHQGKDRLYGGTGLGLSIVKGLVNLIGGDIWLESELGKGTTFYFTIPYLAANPNLKELDLAIQKEDLNFEGIKLLIVEDDIYNLEYLTEIMEPYGFQIYKVELGKQAVKIALEQEPDIILMDIRLPDIDGFEALKQIKAQKPWLKIIAQTAFAAHDDRIKALNHGFDDYISKPIKEEQLIKLLKNHLNSQ